MFATPSSLAFFVLICQHTVRISDFNIHVHSVQEQFYCLNCFAVFAHTLNQPILCGLWLTQTRVPLPPYMPRPLSSMLVSSYIAHIVKTHFTTKLHTYLGLCSQGWRPYRNLFILCWRYPLILIDKTTTETSKFIQTTTPKSMSLRTPCLNRITFAPDYLMPSLSSMHISLWDATIVDNTQNAFWSLFPVTMAVFIGNVA